MIKPGYLALFGVRDAPMRFVLDVRGLSLTGATIAGEVRQRPDNPGDPEIELATGAGAGETGITLGAETIVDGQPRRLVTIYVSEADMAALPAADEIGDTLNWSWRLFITPAGGIKGAYLAGPVNVYGDAAAMGGASARAVDAVITVADEALVIEFTEAGIFTASGGAALIGVAGGQTVQHVLDAIPGQAALVAGQWRRIFGFARLRLTGTGTVTIDARNALGAVTAGVLAYTVSGATNRVEYPFFGDDAVEIRAAFTGSATAEII